MMKELPFSWPITETYQFSSFVMSIILSHNNIKNSYENNYINLFCYKTKRIWDMDLEFWDVTWEDFRKYGIFEMNLFSVDSFSQKTLASFLRERIDQGNYLLLHMVDEFYLPYSDVYQKKHYIHDTYLYGYEEDCFLVMAYKNNKLQQLKVLDSDIVQSVFSSKFYKPEVYFCSLRPNQTVYVNVDYGRIKQSFYDYLGIVGKETKRQMQNHVKSNMLNYVYYQTPFKENYVYGNQIYDVLNECMYEILKGFDSNPEKIDIRPFRLIWEHKRILHERIGYIASRYTISQDIVDSFGDLVVTGNQIFMLAIKYNFSGQKEVLERIIKSVEQLKDKEKKLLITFLDEWNAVEI